MLSTLDQAADKLRDIPCPRCRHLGGLAIMYCGPEPGDCDYFGNCSNCGYLFASIARPPR